MRTLGVRSLCTHRHKLQTATDTRNIFVYYANSAFHPSRVSK